MAFKEIFIALLFLLLSCDNPMNLEKEFWKNNPELREEALKDIDAECRRLKTFDDVRALVRKFHYIAEPKSFQPSIETVFARDLTGNCWSAAVLGKWALECIGIESRFLILSGGHKGQGDHAVVLSNDNTIYLPGSDVVRIVATDTWREAVLTYFNPPFERIKETE